MYTLNLLHSPISQGSVPVLAGVHARDAEHGERGQRARRPRFSVAEHLHRALPRAAQGLAFTPPWCQFQFKFCKSL